MTEQYLKIIKPSGYELHASWFNQGNENLTIICHGGFGDRYEHGRFLAMAERLAEIEYDTLLFDFSGYGENERVPIQLPVMVTDLEDVWNWAKQQNYKKIGTIGLSMGGLVSLCAQIPDRDFAVFWAPGFYLKDSISPFQKFIANIAPKRLLKKTIKMKQTGAGPPLLFELSFVDYVLNFDVDQYLRKFSIPFLIIQGTKDKTVKPEYSEKAFYIMPKDNNHILKMVEGAPHDFKGEHLDAFITHTLTFLTNDF